MTDPTQADSAETRAEHFEFTEADNLVFRQLASRMTLVALAFVVIALFSLPSVLQTDLYALLRFLGLVTIGGMTFAAARPFKAIHQTSGSDIDHLMDAMQGLHRLFTLAAGITGVVFLLIGLALLASIGIVLL